MKAVTAREAMKTDNRTIIISTVTQFNQLVNLETGENMDGVFEIVTMDEDPDDADSLIVTVVDAVTHGVGPEIMCGLTLDAMVVVDINF